jgi:hypothetical protein
MSKRTIEEEFDFYLSLWHYMPWTVQIARTIEDGGDWDREHIAEVLRDAQERLDAYKMKEKDGDNDDS